MSYFLGLSLYQFDFFNFVIAIALFVSAFISFVLNGENFQFGRSKWGWFFIFAVLIFFCRFLSIFFLPILNYDPLPPFKAILMYVSYLFLFGFIAFDIPKDRIQKESILVAVLCFILIIESIVFKELWFFFLTILCFFLPISFFSAKEIYKEFQQIFGQHSFIARIAFCSFLATVVLLTIPVSLNFFGVLILFFLAISSVLFTFIFWFFFLDKKREMTSDASSIFNRREQLLIVIVPIFMLFAAFFIINFSGNFAYILSKEASISYFNEVKTSFYSKMQRIDRLVKSLSGSPYIKSALTDGSPKDLEKAFSALDRYRSSFDVDICYLMNSKGDVITSSNKDEKTSFVGKNFSERKYFKEAMEGNQGRMIAKGLVTGIYGYYSSYPVFGLGKKPLGVVAAKINFSENHFPVQRIVFFFNKNWGVFFASSKGLALEANINKLFSHLISETFEDKTIIINNKLYLFHYEKFLDDNVLCIFEPLDFVIYFRNLATLILFLFFIVYAIFIDLIGKEKEFSLHLKEAQNQILLKSEQLNNFFAASKDFLCIIDSKGRFLKASKSICDFLGFSEERIIGISFLDFVHPDDIESTKEEAQKSFAGNQTPNFMNRYISNNGSVKLLEWSSITKDGLVYAIGRDITEKVKAEKELADYEKFLNTVINSLDEPIFVKDKNHRWLLINESFTKFTGLTKDMAIGKSDYDYFPKEQADVFWEKDQEVFNTKKTIINEEKIIDSFGRERTIFTRKYYFENSSGEPFLVGIILDITEIKTAQEKIEKSQRLLDEMSKTARIGAWELDLKKNEFNWSDVMFEIYEIEGKNYVPQLDNVIKFFFGESQTKVKNAIEAAIKNGQISDLEVELITFKNRKIWARLIIKPYFNENEITKLFGTFQDITEIKAIRDRLKESEEWYRQTLTGITDAVISCDLNGNVVFMNRTAEYLTGWKNEESVNEPLWKVMNLTDLDNNFAENPVYISLRTHSSIENVGDQILTSRNGGQFFIETSSSLIKKSDGTIIGVVLVFRDISERKRNELELKNAKEEAEKAHLAALNMLEDLLKSKEELQIYLKKLEEAIKIKSDFTSKVSHELRTPLTSVKEGISIVLDESAGPLNDDQKQFLTIAKSNVERLHRLVNDILDFSKLESGSVTLNLQQCDISGIILKGVMDYKFLANSKGLYLDFYSEKQIPLIYCDKDKITQVIANLISNSIKFTNEGGIKVNVLYSKEQNEIRVEVIDTGIGIRKEDFDKLFKEYSQIKDPLAGNVEGTGLGLLICKEIIFLHKGKIFVESEFGRGSKFVFTIPVEQNIDVK